jgi:predicted DNA-binding transcriptional regulator YafY
VTLKFTVDGIDEIQRWILGWTGHVRVLSPLVLKDGVIEKLKKGIADNSK